MQRREGREGGKIKVGMIEMTGKGRGRNIRKEGRRNERKERKGRKPVQGKDRVRAGKGRREEVRDEGYRGRGRREGEGRGRK